MNKHLNLNKTLKTYVCFLHFLISEPSRQAVGPPETLPGTTPKLINLFQIITFHHTN